MEGGLFIAKFDPAGAPVWAKNIGGVVQSPRIAVDATGRVFVAGTYFFNAVQTSPITWGGVDTALPANVGATGYDIFVLKIEADGSLATSAQIGVDSYDEMRAIGVDTDGSPVIFGQMAAAGAFRGQAIPKGPFVLEMSAANLDPVWVRPIGIQNAGSVTATQIVPTGGGYLSVAGDYRGEVDWGDGFGFTGSSTPPVSTSGYVLRVKSDDGTVGTGSAYRVSLYGNTNFPGATPATVNLHAASFGTAPEPTTVVAGRFEGWVGLGAGPFLEVGDGGLTSRDPASFVVRYGATTLQPLAFRAILDSPVAFRQKRVAVDLDGNVSVAGSFKGTVDFGGGPLASGGDEDGFVALYDPQLKDVRWSVRVGGPLVDHVDGMGVDSKGDVIVAGEFRGTAAFPSGKTLMSQGGTADVFLMKLAR